MFDTVNRIVLAILLLAIPLACGCIPENEPEVEEQPRPVSVINLEVSEGQSHRVVTGVASPWKTEEIGFEVSGRIEWVIEPDMDIEGHVVDPESNEVLVAGTELARVEDEQYRLAVESSEAELEMAKRQVEASKVEIEQSIPADIAAADAEVALAKTNLDRLTGLREKNATSQSEVDQAQANFDTANAQRAQLDAKLAAANAELKSNEAKVRQSEQSLADANRQLKDTTLISSFRGQTAEVHVVPGSVVNAGEAVVTIQMMDPIKVEVEVSAAQSRQLNYRDILPVILPEENGASEPLPGFVYMIDTSADSQTRTFTLTLLVRNIKQRLDIPPEAADEKVARTADLWRVNFDFLPGTSADEMYIEGRSIHSDDQGFYVWKAENRKVNEPITEENRLMKVSKVYIKPGDRRIPFLGNWIFRQFEPVEEGSIDPETDLFVGELTVDDERGQPVVTEDFDGHLVFLDDQRWPLRPGDLVQVDLTGESNTTAGLFIPINAIVEDNGKKYVFVVDGEVGQKSIAQKIEVKISDQDDLAPSSTRVRIDSGNTGAIREGSKIISGGVHYLEDGEQVLIHSIDKM